MSKYFFERLDLGYAGEKSTRTQQYYIAANITCSLDYCDNLKTKYKGIGSHLCEHHQGLLREYGGPGRYDRPWTMHKNNTCDFCGMSPWEHSMVQQIEDELIRDRVAWGMLIVDHIHTQRDGGSHGADNVQTLCLNCNQIKSTLACDTMPKALYKDEAEYYSVKDRLKPHLDKLFG